MGALKFPSFALVLLVTVTRLLVGAESKTFWGDIEVLKEVRTRSWDFTVDPCDNLFSESFTCGFRCDIVVSESSRVTELSLDQAGYSGSLTSISWNLPYLQTLDLSNNFFYGQIPESVSNLTQLSRLGLSRNMFSGEIPTSIGSLSSLEELYLDNNNLQGNIPASFNGLVSLKRLEVQSNKLDGEFPVLGSLKNLSFLDASENAVSGNVPLTLPESLVQISMRNNSLQGKLHPQSFKNLAFLQVLDLSHNNLSGSVPLPLFTHPSLQQLTLSFNSFTFPASFMALMPKLSALSLENNKFSGMIPIQFAIKTVLPGSRLSPFVRLLLGGNYLYGPIPDRLMELQPGFADVRLNDNCLYRCPVSFFFCRGGDQKSHVECKSFNPLIPRKM
ncbi:LRR receptor serine/threonine-protein kinase [Salix suchowensis]|nr:LRR receptor serine/threonine-protein kinase [Salix suchowensis]